MGTAGDGRENGPPWYEGPESEMGVQPEVEGRDTAAQREREGLPARALVYLVGELGSEADVPKDRHPTSWRLSQGCWKSRQRTWDSR